MFKVCALIVTYGNRRNFLEHVINGLTTSSHALSEILIVDNASSPNTKDYLQKLSNDEKIKIVTVEENSGSAGGYYLGLKKTQACKSDYIWLLDDDNCPEYGALAALCHQYLALSKIKRWDELALLSLREDRRYLKRVASGESVDNAYPPRSSFLSFHAKDIIDKMRRHLRSNARQEKEESQLLEHVRVYWGPYGGLFFHRKILKKSGYPDTRFFTYADDNEFTLRMTKKGISIFLIPSSRIVDVDRSWHVKDEKRTSFSRYLLAGSDFRVYYSIRNQVYFEMQNWTDNKSIYFLNKSIYLIMLWVWSIRLGKTRRFGLIQRAIHDAESGNLGEIEGISFL